MFSAVFRPGIFMEDATASISGIMAAVIQERQTPCVFSGKKAGYITYLGDALKAIFAILVVKYLIYGFWLVPALDFQLLLAYTGLGVALGHNYPFYLKFKGGKGIAVTSGVMLALDLRIGLVGIIGFLILFLRPDMFLWVPFL